MNWIKFKKVFLGVLLTSAVGLRAQDSLKDNSGSLTLASLVSRTLNSNYQIQVSQIQSEQAGNLATRGQAGFFPQINANGSGAFSQNNTKLEFAGGLPDVERNGAVNTSYGANIGLNYTVFNGFGRVYTYRSLVQQSRLSRAQAKLVAENLIFEAINRYVNYQQARLNAEIAKGNLNISEERLRYTQEAFSTGSKTQLDLLSAQLDLKNDSLLYMQSNAAVEKEGFALNVLMGEAPNLPLTLSTEMPIPVLEDEAILVEKVSKNASSVLLAQLSKELSELQNNIANSRKLPALNVSANYGLLSSQNGAGIILAQSNVGFNSSASLVVPLFNGKQLTTAIKNSELDVKLRTYEYEQAKLTATQLIYEAFADQRVLETQIQTLMQSVAVSSKALNRAKEAYATGQIRFNDLRTAQVNALQAESALISARMNLLRLRYSVKRLCGELLD